MWYFFSPKIIYGEDAIDFIENISGKKVFIVTDENLEKLGYLKILTDKLVQFEKQFDVFKDVKPDPHEEDVLKAKEKCIAYQPDIIIALGGGSVMDTAKAAWALYEFPDAVVDDLHPFNMDLYELGKKAKMIAIPTTSGTGAETTWAVVISRYEQDIWKKLEQAHKGLIPTYAIVDPIFPKGMPPSLTADTGFDALAHAVEGFASVWKNEFADAMCLKAIELVFEYLPTAVKDGEDMEARDKMHQAATIAGLGFGNSQAHIGHSMGHSWGAIFHTPHGKCVGIFLPYISQYILNNPDNDEAVKIYARISKKLGWAKWDEDDNAAAHKVVTKIKDLQKEINLSSKLEDTGVSREDFDKNLDELVNLCFQSSSSVMSPRGPNTEDYKKLFTHAYEGKDVDF
ncbi:MAG: iron-containing alcohol dehydrogenase [Candidatus Lokiarchaeota archaeon]|nr:iron-containing alcohol dehydrogenase [Candidatus Lokiarchaeota archaeon]